MNRTYGLFFFIVKNTMFILNVIIVLFYVAVIAITKCERKAPKFIYGDISSLKNNDSISLFFIVLYF